MGAVRSMLRRAAGWREFHCVLGVGLAVLSTSLVVAPADAAETTLVAPVKIMPLGDSITHGVGASGGYRLELKDLLVPAGYSFDFVGSRNSGPYEIEDRQHEGNSGYKIHDIAAIARNRVTTYRPDIVLLVIGTNDVWTDYELDSAPARLGGLIDTIVDAAPAASVIVGSIPPLADSLDDAQARTYNAAVPGVVQARADAGKKVSFVDMYGAMTLADLYDGVHPNADGYFKMANVWRPALEAILPAVPSTGSPNCPCSAWSAGQAPVVSQVGSTSPTEVGVRFRVEQYGYITGVRFFKGPLNTGTHKGSLWARDGRLLASATFTNETASGWQQVNFSSPVVVWPWTTYVASYFAPVGRYAADPAVFTQTEIVSSPVRLLAAGQSGGNGWALGTSTGGFPNVPSSQAANYWVDVVFSPSADPAPPTPPPSAPGNLRVTGTSSSQISLAWNDVVGETGFRVERAPGGTTNWASVAIVPRDNWVFTDTGLAASTTYKYRIIATSRNGDSAPSAVVTATTAALPPPVAPGGVTAVAVSSSQVDVGWQDVAGESGYMVQRSSDGVSGWVQVGTTGQDVVAFSDTGLAASTAYSYRVVATNGSGDSAPSAVVTATTDAPLPSPPVAPGGVTAVAVSSSQVDVGWQDVAGESGYMVQRSLDGVTGWVQVGTTGQDVVAFSDTGLAASTAYSYRVVATNGSGDSAPSAVVSATTPAPDTQPPSTPTKLKATVAKSKVNLTWTGSTDSGSGVAGYRVYRSSTGLEGSFTLLITTASTSASVQAPSGVALWYRVTAYDVAGNESVPSPAVRAVAR
jgi:lysophospholipase L1-like esterase/fibronectin type 3 domain-containing protein